jgi:hypothetical protein
MNTIYAIKENTIDKVVYVGSTSMELSQRLTSHRTGKVLGKKYNSGELDIISLETLNEISPRKERFWINKLIDLGHPLINKGLLGEAKLTTDVDIADRLIYYRKRKQFSQYQVANLIEIGVKRYASYEEGRAEPDLLTLCKLRNLYGLESVEYFIPEL